MLRRSKYIQVFGVECTATVKTPIDALWAKFWLFFYSKSHGFRLLKTKWRDLLTRKVFSRISVGNNKVQSNTSYIIIATNFSNDSFFFQNCVVSEENSKIRLRYLPCTYVCIICVCVFHAVAGRCGTNQDRDRGQQQDSTVDRFNFNAVYVVVDRRIEGLVNDSHCMAWLTFLRSNGCDHGSTSSSDLSLCRSSQRRCKVLRGHLTTLQAQLHRFQFWPLRYWIFVKNRYIDRCWCWCCWCCWYLSSLYSASQNTHSHKHTGTRLCRRQAQSSYAQWRLPQPALLSTAPSPH